MSAGRIADLAVVGLGAFGSAITYQAATLGLDVIGIDQHRPPHELGSSHAETRVTRLAVGEGAAYVPFARRSHEIWRSVERAADTPLLHDHGGLIIAPHDRSDDPRWGNFVEATASVASAAGLEFEQLTPARSRERYPNFLVGVDEVIGHEPTAGIVMAEAAIEAQLRLAEAAGAELRLNTEVTGLGRTADHPVVRTRAGDVGARRVVVAAGAWGPDFHDSERLRVTRQVVYWFEADDLEQWRPEHVGFAIWAGRSIDEYIGVFASPRGGIPGVKVLGERFVTPTTPRTVDRSVGADEIAAFHERMVRPRLAGISDRCLKASVCLYTNTNDDHFLIDDHPEQRDVTVVSACSGHGFKHSAAVGEAVARRLAGLDHLDLGAFTRRARSPF